MATLTDQRVAAQDYCYAEREIRLKFMSVVLLLSLIADLFERQRVGTIAVISSVAGDRGWQSLRYTTRLKKR